MWSCFPCPCPTRWRPSVHTPPFVPSICCNVAVGTSHDFLLCLHVPRCVYKNCPHDEYYPKQCCVSHIFFFTLDGMGVIYNSNYTLFSSFSPQLWMRSRFRKERGVEILPYLFMLSHLVTRLVIACLSTPLAYFSTNGLIAMPPRTLKFPHTLKYFGLSVCHKSLNIRFVTSS